MDRALLAAHGPWIVGWRWSASEPGGGGPVSDYCCAAHSLTDGHDAAVATITGATVAWRGRLEELARLYAELASEARAPEDAAPLAASRLLPIVLEWTAAEDAWYGTFARTVAWALEHQGMDALDAARRVEAALSGRFESWSGPSTETRDAAFAALAEAMRSPPRESLDATASWVATREKVRWDRGRRYAPGPVAQDGHLAYIERIDAARDPVRARRMGRALRRVRRAAERDKPLTYGLLQDAQRVVLGRPASFRTADAYAHDGRERYGLTNRTERRFRRFLEATEDASISPTARAARVYLDVCFHHPFDDGNARAARLALDHVLTRHGLALHAAEPVFLVAKRGIDGNVYQLQIVLDHLSGPRGSR